jgi:signal recognition particle subunit SEC65
MVEDWKRRMVASEPRLSEIVEMYESLGYEVKLEPLDPNDPGWDEEACTLCLDDPVESERTRVVYTRPLTERVRTEEDGLFE